jgi:hypothetical protein
VFEAFPTLFVCIFKIELRLLQRLNVIACIHAMLKILMSKQWGSLGGNCFDAFSCRKKVKPNKIDPEETLTKHKNTDTCSPALKLSQGSVNYQFKRLVFKNGPF